jgi:hypothetical protein
MTSRNQAGRSKRPPFDTFRWPFWPPGVLYDVSRSVLHMYDYRGTVYHVCGVNEMNKEPANSTHHRHGKAASPSSLTHMYHVPPPSCHHASTSVDSHLSLDLFIIELWPGLVVWDTWMVLVADCECVNFVGELYQNDVTQPSWPVKTASIWHFLLAVLTARRALGRQQSCFTHIAIYAGTHRNVL